MEEEYNGQISTQQTRGVLFSFDLKEKSLAKVGREFQITGPMY